MAKKDITAIFEEVFNKLGLVISHPIGCNLEELAEDEKEERCFKQKLDEALRSLGYQIKDLWVYKSGNRYYRLDLELKRIKPHSYRKR